jgi:hypothetical protein
MPGGYCRNNEFGPCGVGLGGGISGGLMQLWRQPALVMLQPLIVGGRADLAVTPPYEGRIGPGALLPGHHMVMRRPGAMVAGRWEMDKIFV